MNNFLKILLFTLTLALMPALSASAQSLHDAAQRVARQHDARVLSANTVEHGGQRVHVIRILTRDGVVRSVEVPAGPAMDRRRDFDRAFDQRRDRGQDPGRDRAGDRSRDPGRNRGGDRPRRDGGDSAPQRDRSGGRDRRRR